MEFQRCHHQYSVLLKLYESSSSVAELISWDSSVTPKAVVKRRLRSADYEMEVGFHEAMSTSSFLFPRVLAYSTEQNFIVLEFYHRGSLQFVLSNQQVPWASKKVYNFLLQLLIALNSLHRLNIVHGDLQAYHILIGDKLNPKLTGFGKARYVPNKQSTDPEFLKDISDLGRIMTGIIHKNLELCKKGGTAEYYSQFPDTFEEAMRGMLASSKSEARSAIELINILSDQSRIEVSTLGNEPQLNDESWLDMETLNSLAELKLEQSLSHVSGHIEERPNMTLAGLSVIRSFRLNVENSAVSFSSGSDRNLFIIGKTVGSVVARMQSNPFPEIELIGLLSMMSTAHREARGKFAISLRPRMIDCKGACCRAVQLNQCVKLDCSDVLCPGCLVSYLRKALDNNVKYSRIDCPICNVRLFPLQENIAKHLPADLKSMLTESLLFETLPTCPRKKCGFQFEVEDEGNPRRIYCPKCKAPICSYCFQKSHYFSCSKFIHDKKKTTK